MNEKLSNIIRDPKTKKILIATGVVCATAGAIYIFNKKRSRTVLVIPPKEVVDHEEVKVIEEPEDEETEIVIIGTERAMEVLAEEDSLDHSATMTPAEEFVAKRLEAELQAHQGSPIVEPVRKSIFAETTTEWDYDEELKKRSPASPYILHKDEFYAAEKEDEGYSQTTLVYYAGDDILVNEDDTPLYNYDSIVGPLMFGHGSDDPKVFHVRNDRRKAEFEIIHDPGLYSVEVLGLQIENNVRVKNLEKFRENQSD